MHLTRSPRFMRHIVVPWLVLAAALAPILLPAQEPRMIEAVRLQEGERIRLDGVLDDAVWERIPPASGFLQQEPHEGAPPTERTEVRIAYDRDNLYIGALLYDSNPEGILAHERQRNASLGTDDRFMWILDTFRDGRSAYFFEINPAGMMGDGLMRSGGTINKAWDGIWEVRVARGGYGWSAEIRLPFRTLNFDPGSETWAINFQRTIRRKNEELLWSGHRRNQGLLWPIHAGLLTGLRDISQGFGLEVRPYAVASARRDGEAARWDTPADLGVDVNYSITPGLRASLSINTDFAEAEVDQRRVNLSRFSLFFPERRDFFLEGSGVFSFAPANGVDPYFSRRIGLVEGEPVPILFGSRLAGQLGAHDLGFLHVRTRPHGQLPGEDFTVARVNRNILAQSLLGVIYTRRATEALTDRTLLPDRHTLGADLNLFTSQFRGRENLRFQAFYVWHNDPTGEGDTALHDRTARGVRLTYPNDPVSGHVSYREFGRHFDPAVGFTPRRGFRRLQPTLSYSPLLPRSPLISRLEWQVHLEHLMDMDWALQTGGLNLTLLGVQFETGDNLRAEFSSSYERLDFDFPIHAEVVIPAGSYSFNQWSVSGSTSGRRRISGGMNVSGGGFWSGTRMQYGSFGTLRPGSGISLTLSGEKNDVQLAEGRFSTHLLRASGGWHLSPWTSLTTTVQYDDVSQVIGLYSRFRWIVRPGSDVFLVYTHNWRSLENALLTLDRGATSKLVYTHRF